jgi:hypothetical protein
VKSRSVCNFDEFWLRVQLRELGVRLCPCSGELAKMTMDPEIEGQLRVKIQKLSILASLLGAAR